jgi:ABC-type lipoprotein release transport system permease subunit
MNQPPIVEARGVHKTYETGTVEVRALQGVDLTLERGEMLVVYAVALAATLAPAVRASRIRPAEALRYE